jgi:hypothetical protein
MGLTLYIKNQSNLKFALQDNQSQTNHRRTNPIPKIRETPKKPYLSKKKVKQFY